jgi:hypothetical protein
MGLLALAPTVSRLLAAGATGGVWTQMCTLTGLTWVKLHSGEGAGVPDPGNDSGHDCAYCPLAHAVAVGAAPVFTAVVPAPYLSKPLFHSPWRPMSARPGGLGSRGPPGVLLTLAIRPIAR